MGAEKEINLAPLAETSNSYVFQQLHVPIAKIHFVVDKHAWAEFKGPTFRKIEMRYLLMMQIYPFLFLH